MSTGTLEAYDVFRFLRPDQVRRLSDSAETVTLSEGEFIYHRGEMATHLYVVLSGRVTLRLPIREGMNVLVDDLGRGAMFGSCVCLDLPTYTVSAQCMQPCELLRIDAGLLKRLMDDDLRMGYALQTEISKTYFSRYLDAMGKLQAVVLNLPLETTVAEASGAVDMTAPSLTQAAGGVGA